MKWEEEQLERGLVYQHLKKVAPPLAIEFAESCHCPSEKVPKRLTDLIEEEQLARSLIYQHLRRVVPTLALEFRDNYHCYLKSAPETLTVFVENALKNILDGVETANVIQGFEGKQEKNNNTGKMGMKKISFSTEQVKRIEKAIAEKEDLRIVAKDIGRTYQAVQKKAFRLQKAKVMKIKRGKFTSEETQRLKQALKNNEGHIEVAKELRRTSQSVQNKLMAMKCNPEPHRGNRNFSVEEDLLILDKIIPRLKFQKLSSTGFLSHSDGMELANEIKRHPRTVGGRWNTFIQPWLLQHYTGTAGLRIERMLTRLVAQKYKDLKGIDWSKIVCEHKEFAGHTSLSLRLVFTNFVHNFKTLNKGCEINLQEVAEYAATIYQPYKESSSKVAWRETILQYFKNRVAALGIDLVV